MATDIAQVLGNLMSFYDFSSKSVVHVGAGGGQLVGYAADARYRGLTPRWICAIARHADGSGFLITAHPTDAVKAGERIWTKSK